MKTISSTELIGMGACSKGLLEFEYIFGSAPVEINLENCLKLSYDSVYWFIQKTMDLDTRMKFYDLIDAINDSYNASLPKDIPRRHQTLHDSRMKAFIEVWNMYQPEPIK